MSVPAPIITSSIVDAPVNKGDVTEDVVPTTFIVSKIDCMNLASDIALESEEKIGVVKDISKPRKALFKGGEDDEPFCDRASCWLQPSRQEADLLATGDW